MPDDRWKATSQKDSVCRVLYFNQSTDKANLGCRSSSSSNNNNGFVVQCVDCALPSEIRETLELK